MRQLICGGRSRFFITFWLFKSCYPERTRKRVQKIPATMVEISVLEDFDG